MKIAKYRCECGSLGYLIMCGQSKINKQNLIASVSVDNGTFAPEMELYHPQIIYIASSGVLIIPFVIWFFGLSMTINTVLEISTWKRQNKTLRSHSGLYILAFVQLMKIKTENAVHVWWLLKWPLVRITVRRTIHLLVNLYSSSRLLISSSTGRGWKYSNQYYHLALPLSSTLSLQSCKNVYTVVCVIIIEQMPNNTDWFSTKKVRIFSYLCRFMSKWLLTMQHRNVHVYLIKTDRLLNIILPYLSLILNGISKLCLSNRRIPYGGLYNSCMPFPLTLSSYFLSASAVQYGMKTKMATKSRSKLSSI